MGMFELYLTDGYAVFTVALALLAGLLLLEFLLLLVGGSLLGLGAEADLDMDLDAGLGELVVDLDGIDTEVLEMFGTEATTPDLMASPASWLGLGQMPVMIWIATMLLGFGVTGIVLQDLATRLIGTPLPALLLALPSALSGVWLARRFGAAFARLLPKTETTAISARHLGRRIGVVTQGTARRGHPCEVRVADRHGNTHYLRGEPLQEAEVIATGTRVLVLRHREGQGYRLVPLGPDL